MGLEVATYISGLNASNPVGVSDPKSQGDDHLRLIKSTLLNTFPNIAGAMNASHTELNRLVGVTGVTGNGNLVLGTSPSIANPSISGTVAGSVTFSGANTHTGTQTLTNVAPRYIFAETGVTANNGVWTFLAQAEDFYMGALNDALDTAGYFLYVTRTNTTIDTIELFSTSLQHNGNIVLTTATGAQLGAANSFTSTNNFGAKVTIDCNQASFEIRQADANTNAKRWHFRTAADTFVFEALNDAGSASNILWVTRSGGTPTLAQFYIPIQASVAVSSETSGALTSASRNTQVHCSGNITLPASGMTDGDVIPIDPRGTARTISRPAAHTMYVNDVDVASATTSAHNICAAKYHGGSKWSLQGAVL